MSYSPLAIKRSYVLGDFYSKCEAIGSIPVYMNDKSGELLGYADESMGVFTDAFLFHLPEDVCKKLSTGHFHYGFDYDFSETSTSRKRRIVLNCFILTGKRNNA